MTWLTKETVKARYEKLNKTPFNDRIDGSIAEAKAEILDAMAQLYDVSGWSLAAPPGLEMLAFPMVYGLTTQGVHGGKDLSASDELGQKLLEEARERLAKYASGERRLVNSSGVLVEQRSDSYKTGLAMLTEPVFGLRGPENYGITRPDNDDGVEWC